MKNGAHVAPRIVLAMRTAIERKRERGEYYPCGNHLKNPP
jgi:hypothetical protein